MRELGPQVGDLTEFSFLGAGGMGQVYRARDANLARDVAVKILPRELSADTERRNRFIREAKVLGRLNHPSIAAIYHFEADADPPHIVMELIDGRPLDQYVAETRLSIAARLELVIRITRAVHYAHERGIVHRDLKPANILVTSDGVPKLLDFGLALLARWENEDTTLRTASGVVMGTLAYMSPEQTTGVLHLDARSDVYALGVITYQLLEGRLPYVLVPGESEVFRIIREEDPRPLSRLPSTLRPPLQAVVGKALEKDKGRRYSTAEEFATDLEHALAGEPIIATQPNVFIRVQRWAGRSERLHQAQWVTRLFVVGSLFHLVFVFVGGAMLAGASIQLAAGLRTTEFTVHHFGWSMLMALLAVLGRRVSAGSIRAGWVALLASVLLFLFTAVVLLGIYRYELGGALTTEIRTPLYALLILFAGWIVVLNAAALHAAHVRQRWAVTARAE
jgi:predicted Ser/Thr protein kinase